MSFKNLIFTLFLVGTLASCSIQVNIDHNADDSGKVGIQMKTENQELFDKFKGQLPENDYLSGLSQMDSVPDMKNSLLPSLAAELFGFKNPTIKELDNGGKEVSLEYKDITKLNGSNEKRDKSKLFFKKEKIA